MSAHIPAEAVEAAEYAIRELWDSGTPVTPQDEARAALEAAAPYLLAQGWDDGVQAQKTWTWNDDMDPLTNPYRTAL